MSLQDYFTDSELEQAYRLGLKISPESPYSEMARILSENGHAVTRQQARWMAIGLNLKTLDPVEHEDSLTLMRERRLQQVNNNKLRARERKVLDALHEVNGFLDGVKEAVSRVNKNDFRLVSQEIQEDRESITVELLLSDLQLGKVDHEYNTSIARKRLQEFTRAAVFQIQQKIEVGYVLDRVVLVLLGDIIESSRKHADSAAATDTSTAEQVANAVEFLFKDVIYPLAMLGVPVDVHGVAGNHDHDDHGMGMFQPGRLLLSYPLYKSLEMLSSAAGLNHVKFNVPKGVFCVDSFYGQTVLYEHGVGVSGTEAGVKKRKNERVEQLGKPIVYFRMGHLHNTTLFNGGQHIINGSFFGSNGAGQEYSSINGYSSEPSQLMITHCPAKHRKFTMYDVFIIRLGHIL